MSDRAASSPETEPEAPAPVKRGWLRPTVAVLGYAAIIALAWRAIDHDKLYEGLHRLRGIHTLAILGLSLLHIAGRAFRYHRLLLRHGPTPYRWTDGFAIFLVGLSTSAVTPARAGDFVKAQLVRKHGVSGSAGFGLVLIERMLDLLVLSTAILVAGLAVSNDAAAIWSRAVVFLLVCLVGGVVMITSKAIRSRFLALAIGLLRRISPARAQTVSERIDTVFETWDTVFKSPVTLVSYFLASFAVWSIEFAKLWCVLVFLGSPASLPAVFFVYPLSILAGVLTLLPFSEGVVGVTSVALLGALAGVDPAIATVAVVVDRGASSLPPILLAMTSSLWRRR